MVYLKITSDNKKTLRYEFMLKTIVLAKIIFFQRSKREISIVDFCNFTRHHHKISGLGKLLFYKGIHHMLKIWTIHSNTEITLEASGLPHSQVPSINKNEKDILKDIKLLIGKQTPQLQTLRTASKQILEEAYFMRTSIEQLAKYYETFGFVSQDQLDLYYIPMKASVDFILQKEPSQNMELPLQLIKYQDTVFEPS
jgi:hypothetical protein